VNEEPKMLEPSLWDQAKRVDYLAISGPVVDGTFSAYSLLMYQLLAGPLVQRLLAEKRSEEKQ
jgi:hypothetical protein